MMNSNSSFRRNYLLIFLLIISFHTSAQNLPVNPSLLHDYWPAHWITCPDVAARAYGVYHFRKTFDLDNIPSHFIIHVTADNRYKLYINGQLIGKGPARGDLYNWNFETYDIAPYLTTGKNCIAALVWNMGVYAPVAQISNQTGFLLQADNKNNNIINTDNSWKVLHDTAYTPCATDMSALLHTYMVTGAGDRVQANKYPWNWQELNYDDKSWPNAVSVDAAAVPVGYGSDNVWTLTPSTIPQMQDSLLRMGSIRRSENIQVTDTFIQPHHSLMIPAHSNVKILIDQHDETTAYPRLIVSDGKGSRVRITYAEALVNDHNEKGNRNDIAGKTIKGLFDIFYPDGGQNRTFTPLWFRTYRYVQLNIHTADDPLVINDFYGMYTGYPFHHVATFASNDSSLQQIWKVGWRTARLCGGETYFDCPYYEELQYEADTRIQSLISLYNSGDDRLMKKAIHDFYDSRVPSGLTQGRFPSNRLQVIPTFSLFWISMLHDYWMLRNDPAFLQQYLDAAKVILDWYAQHIDSSKAMLGPMNWWSFVDWNTAFPGGVPNGATDGNSAVITCQYIYTLHQAAALFSYFGKKTESAKFLQTANYLSKGVYKNCFDRQRMEMANTPQQISFSQHASIFAVLAGVIPATQEKAVMQKVLTDTTLSQATFYFRFYLTRALVKAGLGNLYYAQLTPWRNMLKIGLTTFAENPEPTRSDCHGWSASPEYDFLATICGIQPAEPGFKKVEITPHLGALQHVVASMPHPQGIIKVDLQRKGTNGIHAAISLPAKLSGSFIWGNHHIPLHPGSQLIDIP